MRTLPAVAKVSHILAFDFDGTLHNPAATPQVPRAFFETIQELREKKAAIWGLNTGRSMAQVVDGFLESKFPFLPDFVIAREREIYFPNAFGRWLPHEKWNKACENEVARLFRKARRILQKIRNDIESQTGARWLEMDGDPAGVIAQSEEEMEWIVEKISEIAAEIPTLGWQRNSIWLRFGHRNFQKGSSLSEIARLYGLGADCCFAIGDSHNDFDMLDPAHAVMHACPANAVEEIKARVKSGNGYICQATHGEAVVEALHFYFQ